MLQNQDEKNRNIFNILSNFLINQKNDLLETNGIYYTSDNAYLNLSQPLQEQYLQIQNRLDKVYKCIISNSFSFLTEKDIEWVNKILDNYK
jgi:hypothetical protein